MAVQHAEVAQETDVLEFVIKTVCRVPWEELIHTAPTAPTQPKKAAPIVRAALPAPASPPSAQGSERIARPGCTAADETLVVKGHLEGIVDGHWGTGVLQHDLARLDRAIAGSRQMGAEDVAIEIGQIKEQLPTVRSKEAAAPLLAQVDAIVPKVGDLAKKCGRAGSPEVWKKAQALAQDVAAGKITREEAIAQLKAD